MQSKNSIERWYRKEDPWKYADNPDDAARKERILEACRRFAPEGGYSKALDIGAGEGWITKDLPARELWGYEISDRAASRWPPEANMGRISGASMLIPGSFDLVLLAGVMYPQYDHLFMALMAAAAAGRTVVTCNIVGKKWECYRFSEKRKLHEETFPYRGMTERLAVYDFSSS